MFDHHTRARSSTLGALLCAAAVTVTACAHTQQTPPADSVSPRQYGGHGSMHGGMHGNMRGGRGGDRMMADLDLTKDQRAQIQLIRDRYKLQADSMRLNTSGGDSTSRAAFHTMMTQEMGEIRGVLTPGQQKKFDDRMAKMREHRRMHERNGVPSDSSTAPPSA
jgi:Spy/CpxP family protein refolding chaperone